MTQIWDWQMRAACRDLDSELFFHPSNERGPAANARDRAAKVVCSGCPVLEECRSHALDVHEPYGVWGGLTARERETILRRSYQRTPLSELSGTDRPEVVDLSATGLAEDTGAGGIDHDGAGDDDGGDWAEHLPSLMRG
ncbi:WhiB family transcriptional regulator [Pseudonocardia sediminis]|uniref:WhiB family transcriptional regulator n=1 Tax=Pseudonocardia sediminis TaxID=1397368 RepID=UPI003BF81B81